jgi:hypothetical protein
MRYYAACSGNSLPYVSWQSIGTETSVRNCHYSPRNNPQERSSLDKGIWFVADRCGPQNHLDVAAGIQSQDGRLQSNRFSVLWCPFSFCEFEGRIIVDGKDQFRTHIKEKDFVSLVIPLYHNIWNARGFTTARLRRQIRMHLMRQPFKA